MATQEILLAWSADRRHVTVTGKVSDAIWKDLMSNEIYVLQEW